MASGLEGQVAIVTGAGAGIGLACADRLARAGTAVCIADIDAEAATAAAGMLENAGHRCISITADISDSDQVVITVQKGMPAASLLFTSGLFGAAGIALRRRHQRAKARGQ